MGIELEYIATFSITDTHLAPYLELLNNSIDMNIELAEKFCSYFQEFAFSVLIEDDTAENQPLVQKKRTIQQQQNAIFAILNRLVYCF